MSDKVTAPAIRAMKGGGQKVVCVTAYDAPFGAMADEAGVDLVLVGDSVGNVVLGYDSTLPVTLEEMVHHTKAVRRGVKRALLVSDLPFGSYGGSIEQTFNSSVALMKAGAEAVKLEGTSEAIPNLVDAGIPVMGHVGMTPQSVHKFGGFRVQGRGGSAEAVLKAAKSVEEAGAFAIVLELIPADLAARITQELTIPTIGIGAGEACDGQVQVLYDMLGFSEHVFKHAKDYMQGRKQAVEGLRKYVCEVRNGAFPTSENSF
jgi:3-methyl-2-oxobutanoate hydroxymethyltransferase